MDTKTSNKADIEASDRADTRNSNKVGMIMGPEFENKVVNKIGSKVDIKISYGLDFLISKNNYSKNFLSYNFANILANFFGDLLYVSIDFCNFFVFLVSFLNFAISNNMISLKSLNYKSLIGSDICNLDNILGFYY